MKSKQRKMPPEIKAAYDEGHKLLDELKAEWNRRRDAEYEKYFNEPAIVEHASHRVRVKTGHGGSGAGVVAGNSHNDA